MQKQTGPGPIFAIVSCIRVAELRGATIVYLSVWDSALGCTSDFTHLSSRLIGMSVAQIVAMTCTAHRIQSFSHTSVLGAAIQLRSLIRKQKGENAVLEV